MIQENDNEIQQGNNTAKSSIAGGDLPDSPHDEERMQPEEFILDLPDVKDIPGQENIHPPHMESFADTTISSADEEGEGLFGDEEDEDEDLLNDDENVSLQEKASLEAAADDVPTADNRNLRKATLDNDDMEGELLNVAASGTDLSGSDLDTSGVDGDDAMEAIGEEDEENNSYSLGGDDNDDVTEGTT